MGWITQASVFQNNLFFTWIFYMMKRHFTIPAMIAISAALLCSACNKNVDVQNATEQGWNESEVNSLFKYVPADSPMVIATTRKVDLNHPNQQAMRNKTAKLISNLNQVLNEKLNYSETEPDESAKEVLNLVGEFNDLIANYSQNAPKYGLNPDHMDAVAYIKNGYTVVKFTVDNADQFKTALASKIQTNPMLSKNITIKEDDVSNTKVHRIKIKNKLPEFIVKYDHAVVTVIPYGEVNDQLKQFIAADLDQKVPQTFDKSKLGIIEKDTFRKGYADNPRVFDVVLKSFMKKYVEKHMNTSLSQACDHELVEKMGAIPATDFDIQIASSGNLSAHTYLSVKDKERLDKINSLKAGRPDLITKNTRAGMQISMKVRETIDYLLDNYDSPDSQFTCPELQNYKNSSDREVKELKEYYMFAKALIGGITGLTISLEKFYDLKSKKVDGFLDSIFIRLDGPEDTLKSIMDMAVGLYSDLEPVLPKKAGDVVPVDLNSMISVPFKGNVMLSDHALAVASTDKNIRQIATSNAIATDEFFRLTLSSGVLFYWLMKDAVESDDDQYISLTDSLINQTPVQTSFAFGNNDHASTMTFEWDYLY